MDVQVNSIVGRRSYRCDVLFRVIDIQEKDNEQIAILYGEDYRLIADAPFQDLVQINQEERSKITKEVESLEEQSYELFQQDIHLLREQLDYEATNGYSEDVSYFQVPGRVLHLDGDPVYLKKCLDLYEKIGISVYGVHCQEKEMPYRIGSLIEKYQPDILVVTGHDAYSKMKGKKADLNAYRHSKSFVKTVREARKKVPNLDQLVIFAGACQSHFESLIQAGANFASSPLRVNIHALDPVYIVAKICYTSFMNQVNVWDVLKNTLTGEKGLGGVETKGVLRIGMPYKPINDQ
ncbi:sporulation peptidase YabG [Heyndrickxia ginsengihumi]|uniref:Peptidase n=1 Tax=Heyndrickxia ginsengihumi TaxID=363870 RepID=A0A0A6VBR4_9BACI|nr:sporulation peptidase YabG [Heyndrickxia ginsengihumi]KHD85016.1 peptidase [Heyndrickxia ginsengihumi]MBE6183210.1 sporulation peptidase YabG [Bacillus sp. (in: firmicutes)]MCM3024360.1 sporulation peptidase YabG [Heyndrickxia ginsengihumi]NEY21162.1 sporulation peptidase YabG [Heyndrickxia ginsengihumi]